MASEQNGLALSPLELEHAIGFNAVRSGLHAIPGSSKYVHVVGCCIVFSDLADEHNQSFVRGHDDDITALSVSRSGRFIVSGQRGHNCDVCLWDAATSQILQRFSEIENGVIAVDISHDDSIVAAVGQDLRLCFFDTSNGGLITHAPLAHMVQPTDIVRAAVFGGKVEDLKRRDTGAFHFCLLTKEHVWPFHLDPFAAALTPLKLNLTPFQRHYSTARYSNHGDLLFIGSDAGDIATVATSTGTVVHTCRACSNGVTEMIVAPQENSATSASQGFRYARFGPGSERSSVVYIGGGDGTVAALAVKDHSEPALGITAKRRIEDAVCGLALTGPSTLLVGSKTGSTYKVTLDPSVKVLTHGVNKWCDAVDAAYDLLVTHPSTPEVCVTASRDGIVRQWELNGYSCAGVFEIDAKQSSLTGTVVCTGVCLSDGLEIQLSSWTDGCVRCHDMTNFRLLWRHAEAHRSPVTAIALSRSMKFFVTGSAQGEIKMWDMRTRELQGELKDHQQAVVSLRIFDDDRHLISASKDRTLVTWDLASSRRLTSHETHSGPLTCMLLCRNQCNVFTAGADRLINYWDLRQKEPVRSTVYSDPSSGDAYCTTLCASSDERFVATGGTDQVVRLWDGSTMSAIATGYGHSGTISRVAFTCDDKQIVSCGLDSALMIWNVYAGGDRS